MRIRVGLAQINLTVGDLDGNVAKIIAYAQDAQAAGCDVVAFPEMAVTGYPPEDLLLKPAFIASATAATAEVAEATPEIVQVVGTIARDGDLRNAAAVCAGGSIVGRYTKRFLPNYGVFDEPRYFAAGATAGPLFKLRGVTFGVTICEDVWMPEGPLLDQARAGAELALNINASPYHRRKHDFRTAMLATRASDAAVPLAFVNMVGGQDELVFDGASMLLAPDGELLASAPMFEECLRVWDIDCSHAFRRRLRDTRPRAWGPLDLPVVDLDDPSYGLPAAAAPISEETLEAFGGGAGADGVDAASTPPTAADTAPALDDADEVYTALVVGTRDYLVKNGFPDAVVGLSGGIDSSLTAAIAVDALGAGNVTGIAMPSPYSSEHSRADAEQLAANLGIRYEVVPIDKAFAAMLETLDPLFAGTEPDVAEENVQARLRGIILMGFSNKFGALLLTTGNKSELATGYATLYGDMAGGFAVLEDVPKVLVYTLSERRNARAGFDLIPESVLTKPPSAELAPDQLDADSLPPYDVLDPILEAYVEHDMVAAEIVAAGLGPPEIVEQIARLVDSSEYKRRQAPPGVRITPKAFGRDRRLPITNRFRP